MHDNHHVFSVDAQPICDTDLAPRMTGRTWRADAPIRLEALTLLRLNHIDFTGRSKQGEIIIHTAIQDRVVEVFRTLFVRRFPIDQLRLMHHYEGDDDAAMADNNSSGFNARPVTGAVSGWSKHSYGIAIDINPLINPYCVDGQTFPAAGVAYADREVDTLGLIRRDGPCYQAFKKQGFVWGGDWSTVKDYHHFELPLSCIGLSP
ncbi:MAG: M15 family metallopeptidase [Myxococcota bacterium]|nr:M15 family metallopeptidase [Myxococcota bacterium]